MKIALVAMLFAASALAQTPSSAPLAACGPDQVIFNVSPGGSQQTPAQPEPGKATVYFIQDNGPMGNTLHSTLRIGLDGAWVGAYQQNSYLSVSVVPGEHHVCANVQPGFSIEQPVALAHFTAEPGGIYYFRTLFLAEITTQYPTAPHLDIHPLDSDEGKYLIASYPLSVATAKK